MAILINEKTRILIQGITGKQGAQACKAMLDYGTHVVCGVTPGKGGQEVEGVPVYDTVKEALSKHAVDASLIIVPPALTKDAALEALAAGVKLLNIITETVPIHDTASIIAKAREKNAMIIGPTSIGIMSPGKAKMGVIASGESARAFALGSIGIISKSGGMSAETCLVLKQAGLGASTIVGIGADVLIGTPFVDIVKLFENDTETKGIVLFGEIGGTAEEDLADYLIERRREGKPYPKPIAAFISGKFSETLPKDVTLGHAGAIIEGDKGTRQSKIDALKKAGVLLAEVHHELGAIIKEAIRP